MTKQVTDSSNLRVRISADNGETFARACLTDFTLDINFDLNDTTTLCDDVKDYAQSYTEFSVSFDTFYSEDSVAFTTIQQAALAKLAIPMEVGGSYREGTPYQSGQLIVESISHSSSVGEQQKISVSGKFVKVVNGIRQVRV